MYMFGQILVDGWQCNACSNVLVMVMKNYSVCIVLSCMYNIIIIINFVLA